MPGRRAPTADSRRARGLPATALLVLLLPAVASCGQDVSASAEPTPAVQASTASPTGAATAGPHGPGSPAPRATPRSPAPERGARDVRGGGFASSVPGSDAPDRKADTGPVFALGEDGPDLEEIERLVEAVERIAAQQATEDPLATGGSLAAAVGTFSYRYFADGTVAPDPAWVAANIRTEQVPILGAVTGHEVLFPQLRGALEEVVARGLADRIDPGQFGGCYVPRFIGRDPAQGLSLHTWGIAVDLNVPGNQRGTVGEMDRTVVDIFQRWGFAWGGDWGYTDPMHFELARLVRAP